MLRERYGPDKLFEEIVGMMPSMDKALVHLGLNRPGVRWQEPYLDMSSEKASP
jgi:hypothetical protein